MLHPFSFVIVVEVTIRTATNKTGVTETRPLIRLTELPSAGTQPALQATPAMTVTLQLDGLPGEWAVAVPAPATVADVTKIASSAFALEVESLWDGDIELDRSDAFAKFFQAGAVFVAKPKMTA